MTIREQYEQIGLSIRQIADRNGMSWASVQRKLVAMGTRMRTPGGASHLPENLRSLIVEDRMKGELQKNIAKRRRCSINHVSRVLVSAGMRSR